jgi:hypothetical protein
MRGKILTLLMMVSFAFVSCEDDSDSESSLYKVPSEIQAYVDQHFPEQAIIQAILDKEDQNSKYELLLDNFIKLEFSHEKEIIEIDGSIKLPDSVIPANILSYVSSNYADSYITSWELEHGYQQIQLNNHVEIEFSLEGEFIRIDD